jgi:hypothetical protein
MKTRKSSHRQLLFISSVLVFSIFLVTACHKDKNNTTPTNKTYTISGNASGSQVVPSVADSGTATISGTFSTQNNMLITTTNWSNLTGRATSGGFYQGASGVNGSLIGTAWALPLADSTGTGTFSDTMTLTADQATQLTTGNWYYILGTTANPNGEVRGQVTATPQ